MLLSAANQFFVEAGMTCTEAGTVLVLFVKALGGSNFLAGMLPSLRFLGWLMPQFLAAGRLRRMSRMLPAVRVLEAVRFSAYFAMAGLTLAYAATRPGWVLAAFFALYLATRVAAGSSAVARAELVGGLVPPQERAALVSLRLFSGGVAGFLSGFVVRHVLAADVGRSGAGYAALLGLSGAAFLLAVGVLSLVRESPRTPEVGDAGVVEQLRGAPALLRRDRRLALYVGVRAAATGFEMAAPFYIIYATDRLGAPAALAGVYISLRTLSRVASNLYWGRRCRRSGSLSVVRSGLALGVLAPLAVLGFLAAAPLWRGAWAELGAWLFGAVFLLDGLGLAAFGVGRVAYLYEIAPRAQFATYFGLANTILGPLYFLPALGGALADAVGFAPIFGGAALLLAGGYLLAGRLEGHPPATGERDAARHPEPGASVGGD